MANNNVSNVPQNTFQNNQGFSPNIQEMYKHFVTGGGTPNDNETGENIGIDDIRGEISVNVTGQTTKNLITSLNITPATNASSPQPSTPNTSTPVNLAQESRCHAFYRIIGFPVISADKKSFYNPGFDVIKQQGIARKITLATKISIAGNLDPAFEKLSQKREAYANSTLQVFSNPQTIEAGVLSLMSGTYGKNGNINIRKFSLPYQNSTDPFNFTPINQANQISIFRTASLVGGNEVLLSDYQDANGIKPLENLSSMSGVDPNIFVQHYHIITPFMVDPRIDFSIWTNESKTSSGISRRIAVPFVPDATYLKTSITSKAERPLLEKVITDRVSQYNNVDDSGTAAQNIVDYVKSFKYIQNINLGGSITIGNIFNSQLFKISQQQAFATYLSIIEAMMDKLFDSMRIIHSIQGKYYWLPQPSPLGPDSGGSVRPVPLNQNISSQLITENDFNIINSQIQSLLSNITSSTSDANTVPDRGGFAFNAFFNNKNTFDYTTSDSLGSVSSTTMETLTDKRTKLLNQANDALQTVEMIMGEYSGLGLCDIIAIVGALYIVDINSLVGFLDLDAYARAKTLLGDTLPSQNDLSTSMTNFSNAVNGFYQIMDKTYQDFLTNNSLNIG